MHWQPDENVMVKGMLVIGSLSLRTCGFIIEDGT